MVLVWYVALFSEMYCNMDYFDRPKCCPLVDGVPLRYSVGYYRGSHRVVVAWFADFDAAFDYLTRTRSRYPHYEVDLLQSIF